MGVEVVDGDGGGVVFGDGFFGGFVEDVFGEDGGVLDG